MLLTRTVRIDEREVTVSVRPDGALEIDGKPVTVTPAGRNAWRVTLGSRALLVHAAGPSQEPWIAVDGIVVRADIAAAGTSRRSRRNEPEGLLSAPMPATVRTVLVQPGRRVAKGETLLVLEAMKMELPLRTPAQGVVKAVHCREGDLVQPGVTLVEIE